MSEQDNIEKMRDCTAVVLDVSTLSDEEIDQLVELDNSIFPDMPVEKSEIVESLKSKGVQVALKNPEGKVVGLLTSLPHNQAIEYLLEDDPELKEDPSALYVESIGVHEEYRTFKNIRDIWIKFSEEAVRLGYTKVTGHFRVSQGLSDVVQKKLDGKFFRRMENWADFGEPFDYIEVEL